MNAVCHFPPNIYVYMLSNSAGISETAEIRWPHIDNNPSRDKMDVQLGGGPLGMTICENAFTWTTSSSEHSGLTSKKEK